MASTQPDPTPERPVEGAPSDRLGLVGTTIADKYRVERVVGEGGFGIVYRARHRIWDEPVAVKCFTALANAPVELRPELHAQFIREGKLLTALSSRSTGIVQAHDIGELTTPTGLWLPYMVLEWLDGRPLEAFLGHHDGQPAGPARDALAVHQLMDGPARALSLAHARNVAHRDIKPANFFVLGPDLTPGTIIKVLDFGIAKVMQSHTGDALHATGAQISSFTPGYGAPEQFDRRHGATGPWTDVFQMALVLVELMRGGLSALDGEDFVQLAFSSQNPARRPTPRTLGLTTSDAVEAVFHRALAVKVVDRYRDMAEFWAAFADAVDAAPATRPHPPSRPLAAAGAAAYDVVLEFSRARDAGRPNAFEFSPQTYLLHSAGGGVETAEFPWTPQFLDDLRTTQLPGHAPEAMHRIGETLRTFLAGAGWSYHERAIMAAARDGAPIFITIRSAAAELYALPWEFVALKATGQLLGSIPGLLIRYEWPEAPAFPDRVAADRRRGRVLIAWSAAGGAVPADRLIATVRAAYKNHPGAFDPHRDVIAHATVGKIDRALDEAARAGPPIDALHILCHGTAIGATYGLALDDEFAPGSAVAVDASHVQQLLAPHAAMLHMVVLAACDSGNVGKPGNHLGSVAQMIHRAGLRAVVASRYPLSVDGSTNFAAAFYGALVGEAASLEHAFLSARDALLSDPAEIDWASIQLYSRDADGHATRPLRLVDPTASRPAVAPERPPPQAPVHRTTLPTPARARRPPRLLLPALGLAALGLAGLFVVPPLLRGDPESPANPSPVEPAKSSEMPTPAVPKQPAKAALDSKNSPASTDTKLDTKTAVVRPVDDPDAKLGTKTNVVPPVADPDAKLDTKSTPVDTKTVAPPDEKQLSKKKTITKPVQPPDPPPTPKKFSNQSIGGIETGLDAADTAALAACNSGAASRVTIQICLQPGGSLSVVQPRRPDAAIDSSCLSRAIRKELRSVTFDPEDNSCRDFQLTVPSL